MSKHLELSPRLKTVAQLVRPGARLVDVGTDHAYLPAALLLEGRIEGAVAADLRRGPLDRARQTAREYGCTERMEFRLCDGLSAIAPEEVDTVVIAGMGGETIAQILAAAPWTREEGVRLILQPMSGQHQLRAWLQGAGYCILEERLAKEGETLYVVLLVQGGEMGRQTPAQLWAGAQSRDPLRGEWLDHLLEKTKRALDGLAKARSAQGEPRRRELEQVYAGLTDMKKEWDTW